MAARAKRYEQDIEGDVATMTAPVGGDEVEQAAEPTEQGAHAPHASESDIDGLLEGLIAMTATDPRSPIHLTFEATLYNDTAAQVRQEIDAAVEATIDAEVTRAKEQYAASTEATAWTEHLQRRKQLTRDLSIAEAEYEQAVAAVRVATAKGSDPNELVRQREVMPGKIEGLRTWLRELEPILDRAEQDARQLWSKLLRRAHDCAVRPAITFKQRTDASLVKVILPHLKEQLIAYLLLASQVNTVAARYPVPMDEDLIEVA